MTNNKVQVNQHQRKTCSWRYVSPSKLKSQDYYDAFVLRPTEKSLSFDVNSNSLISKEEKRSEIYIIYDLKGYDTNKNGRFIMVDLINAEEEANLGKDRLNAVIDKKNHCSLYYLDDWYQKEDDSEKLEVFTILFYNIRDNIPTSKNDDGQIVICRKWIKLYGLTRVSWMLNMKRFNIQDTLWLDAY